MGVRDAQRLGPVKAAIEGRITNAKGAELTGLSLRQFKRLKARVRSSGAAGLLHGNRGRPSSRRLGDGTRAEIVGLLLRDAPRLNDCHVRDVLEERGVTVSAETVRQVRCALGLRAKHHRRPRQHRQRRLRAARVGSLVLIDGSEHAWLGPLQPKFTIVGTLDDATGRPLSLVRRPHEDLHGFTQALRETIENFGVPEALYGDRTGIAVRNDGYWSREEELEGRRRPTQFGRMLEELGIRYIAANSPEAKGRIERFWFVVQDRLVAELALRGITTLEGFDAFVPTFIGRCRDWFAKPARESVEAWRGVPRNLDRILACRYTRIVGRDNIVTIPGDALQIPPGPRQRSFARARVEVREKLDGGIVVLKDGALLHERPAPEGPFTLMPRDSADRARRPKRRTLLAELLSAAPARRTRSAAELPAGDRMLLARTNRKPPKDHPLKRNPVVRPSTAGLAGRG